MLSIYLVLLPTWCDGALFLYVCVCVCLAGDGRLLCLVFIRTSTDLEFVLFCFVVGFSFLSFSHKMPVLEKWRKRMEIICLYLIGLALLLGCSFPLCLR